MRELPIPTFDLSPDQRKHRALPLRRRTQAAVAPFLTVISSPTTDAPLPQSGAESSPVLQIQWARHLDEVREAQRLRYAVFAQEMGATLQGDIAGHDIDRFDDYCEHLLVREQTSGLVVGTYRLLTPAQAQRAGGLYSETEFDLSALAHLRSNMVELGRSCVHPEHRNGGVIMALWGALADFLSSNGLDTMIGCASIPMQHQGLPSGYAAASIWEQVRHKYMAAPQYHVSPHLPLPVQALQNDAVVEPPALIKGYLRLGTKVLGAPAWDPQFNSADLPMMMRIADLPSRYRKHFLGA